MRSERGQAAVEFALVLPFLILIICGVIDFGRILYTANALTGVCERGARYASINPSKTNAEIQSKVQEYVPPGIDNTKIVPVNTTPNTPSGRASGVSVTVTFSYSMDYVTPFIKNLLSSNFKTLNFSSTCRVE